MKSGKDKPNYSMTNCTKTGIKIKENGNGYKNNPFEGVNPFKEIDRVNVNYETSQYANLDLNIASYSREDIYKLFGLQSSAFLTEENMKEAKKIVLKTHPDKSRLGNEYFIFFQKAYQKIMEIYEFQNKINTKKKADTNEYYEKQNANVLDKMFDTKKDLKDPKKFNNWFNDQFDKHRLDDPVEHGYGDWLKSDSDIDFTPQTNINKDNMGREMEKRKHKLQEMIPYKGISDTIMGSSVGGSSLMEYNSNFSSGSLFSGGGIDYTDLRQAYVESVIPVTEEDFNKVQKFNSVDEYKRHRENYTNNDKMLTKEESMRQLYNQDKQKNEESAALAFYYAQQSEKVKQNNNQFWSGLNQLTN
jgi:hypothetical protein